MLFACFQTGYTETVERMRQAAERTDLSFQQRLPIVINEVYNAIVSSGAGRMAPAVVETTGRIPEVAQRFNDEFIEEMHEIFEAFAKGGMKAGEFEPFDLGALDHALFGVAVNLTLCRSMFAKFPTLNSATMLKPSKRSIR